MSAGLPRATLLENLRFNAVAVIPNAVQGIFRRRSTAVAVATRASTDGHAVALLADMARRYGRRPVRVRIGRDSAVLLLDPGDVATVLAGAPEPYASDSPVRRDGMVAFQPDAVTISRGALWRNRRRFNEAVLKIPRDRKPPRAWIDTCDEELDRMLANPAAATAALDWDAFEAMLQRVARRIILGDGAAGDEGLTNLLAELMSVANGIPGEAGVEVAELEGMIAHHVERADRGSLVARFAEAPSDARTNPVGQIPHWLFALGDTLAINAFRALAVLGSDAGELAAARGSRAYVGACLQEAMRLWPTTAMLSRVTTEEVELGGETVAAGTQIVISNLFCHRDRDRFEWADDFVPEEWIDGDAAREPAFNQFGRGPQGCPGRTLAMTVGSELLGGLIERRTPATLPRRLDLKHPLPHMLDFFSIRVRLDPA